MGVHEGASKRRYHQVAINEAGPFAEDERRESGPVGWVWQTEEWAQQA